MFNFRRTPLPLDRRQQMIDETGAWLTWALRTDVQVPRIPRQRVDQGGYTPLLKTPGARAAVEHWWYRALDTVGKLSQ